MIKIPKGKTFLLITLVFIWFAILSAATVLANFLIEYKPGFPYAQTLNDSYQLPKRLTWLGHFDGVHYLTIVEKGYIGTGLIQAFFPAFPALIWLINQIIPNTLLAAGIVSTTLAIILFILWWLAISDMFSTKLAWISLLTLMTFPTSFFLGAVYTESLFLILVLLSFWQAHKKRWWLSIAAAAVASATKVVGIWLVPSLMLIAWQQTNSPSTLSSLVSFAKKRWQLLAGISFGSIGLFSYMFYLWQTFSDSLYFFSVQAEFGGGRQESIIVWPQVVYRYLRIMGTTNMLSLNGYTVIQEFLAGTLVLVLLLLAAKKVPWGWTFFSLAAFITPTLTGTFSSMPRYVLTAPTLFIFIALLLEKKPVYRFIWLSLSTVWLFWNTILFIQGYWVA